MQSPFDDTKFLAQFPLWMLLHETALSRGLIKLSGENGEVSFPLFTDQDLAERFQASVPGLAHYTLGMASDREALTPVLDMLALQAFTHVAIDPTSTRQMVFGIETLRAALQGDETAD